jgi:bacteriocin-like protein
MSCELGKCESSNLANNYQDCSLILREIANDEELKDLTEEDLKAIIGGGLRLPLIYGSVSLF